MSSDLKGGGPNAFARQGSWVQFPSAQPRCEKYNVLPEARCKILVAFH